MSDSSELDAYFGPKRDERPLGIVLDGSLSAGLQVKLDPRYAIEKLAVGRYVVIQSRKTGSTFFGIITDIALGATTPDLLHHPPDASDTFLLDVYSGGVAYATLHVSPMLMLDEEDDQPRPIKTIPSHFSAIYEATAQDVARVFGEEDEEHFYIGTPLDMEDVQVNLDLTRFVDRSSGVFGKTGTGKSFVTRTILAGIIRSGLASTLIFDMHNDYGWSVKDESGREYKGLRQLFPDGRVSVITLDEPTSRARGSKFDGILTIGYEEIEPEDIELLASLLGLSDIQTGALYFLYQRLGKKWISKLLDEQHEEEIQTILESGRIVGGTLGAIQRKLESFVPRMGFLVPGEGSKVVDDIFQRLNIGTSVVLEFGNYGNTLA
ncbi:MAG: ATP-binding protein, partial [Anaerolineales bacterium]|nr:ATP-binding protein [Anaerolineales bacterium]